MFSQIDVVDEDNLSKDISFELISQEEIRLLLLLMFVVEPFQCQLNEFFISFHSFGYSTVSEVASVMMMIGRMLVGHCFPAGLCVAS